LTIPKNLAGGFIGKSREAFVWVQGNVKTIEFRSFENRITETNREAGFLEDLGRLISGQLRLN
jgi:hypothetical protein